LPDGYISLPLLEMMRYGLGRADIFTRQLAEQIARPRRRVAGASAWAGGRVSRLGGCARVRCKPADMLHNPHLPQHSRGASALYRAESNS
jgi:hypothetical protein